MLETRIIRNLEPLLMEALDTNDFRKYEGQSRRNDTVYLELSRQLRARLIDCVYMKDGKHLMTLTRSLKEKDAIQITGYVYKEDGTLSAGYDVQATDYQTLLHETGSHHGKLYIYTID